MQLLCIFCLAEVDADMNQQPYSSRATAVNTYAHISTEACCECCAGEPAVLLCL